MKFNPDTKSRFRILKGGKISLIVSALLSSATISFAAPSGGVVTSGTANISVSGTTTNINQASQKASINWNNFSIASNETVNFNQPNVNSITLNRVVGNERSVINGALNANGQVWLLNSNGILFGKNASINTAGLLATTSNISDANFNAGNYTFEGSSDNSVINLGTIDITDSGYATLLAKEVSNEGTIKAIRGKVTLIGASKVNINFNGNSLVNLTVEKGVLDALVENKGAIYANGGEIYLTTNAVDELLKGVVNNTGIVEAKSLDDMMGKVELFAHGGTVKVDGTLKSEGGFIETSGRQFEIGSSARIETSHWLIDPVNITIDNTLATAVESALNSADVTITTDGGNTPDTSSGESGSTGNIILASNITTGALSADRTLTLDVHNDIIFNDGISIDATQNSNSNKLNIVLNADKDNNDSGSIILKGTSGASIKSNNGDVNFNGKLESDVANESPLSIDAGTGTIAFDNDVGENRALKSLTTTAQYVDFGSKTDYVNTLDEQVYNAKVRLTGTAQFTNASFEDGTTNGWSIFNNQIYLNGANGSKLGGYATPNDTVFPATTTGSGAKDNHSFRGSFTSEISTDVDASSGTYSLKMRSSGSTTGYGIIHGSSVISDSTVSLEAGGTVSFKWKAAGGSDAYDVFGYILNTATGATQIILNETGASGRASTNWDTSSVTVNNSGNYKFAFISGSWDASGGTALGAQLFIDDIRAFSEKKFNAGSINFADSVDSGSNPLTITADKLNLGGNVSGTGDLVIKTRTAGNKIELGKTTASSDNSVLSLTDDKLSKIQDGFSNITFGDSNAGKVTVDSTTLSDNVKIQSGNDGIEIVDSLNVGTNSLTLESTGTVTDTSSGSLTASSLALAGSGSFTLDNENNDVDTLAAGTSSSKVGAVTFVDKDEVNITDVSGQSGVNSSGDIDISTLTGNITLSSSIATTSATNTAVTLNAGKSQATGTSTGGDIIRSGSSTITVGSGGRSTLYTGSISGSSNIRYYIGYGSGKFRYNSDESDTNYTSALGAGNYLVYREKITLKVSAASNSITYGDALPTGVTTSYTGYQNGDNETSAAITGTSSFTTTGATNSSSGNRNVGSYDLVYDRGLLSGLGYGFEDNASSTNELTVNAKAITLSASGVNKVYDGTTTSSATLNSSGVLSSDVISFLGNASFANKDAGTAKTVNVNTFSKSGTDSANYTISNTSTTTTADITKKTISVINSVASSKVYDGNTNASLSNNGTLSGVISGDSVGFTSTATFDNKNVGTSKVVSLDHTINGTNASNYILSDGSTSGTITPKAITARANDLTKIYGNADATLTHVASGLVGSDTLSGALSRVAGENVGQYTISKGALANSNYDITFTNGQYTITPKAITVSADDLTKVYGTADANLTYVANGLVGSDTLNGSLSRAVGKNVGQYTISKGALANANYDITFTNGQYTITPKPITVRANDISKVYGSADRKLTFETNELERGDSLRGLLTRVAGENVGEYVISQGALENSNYEITFVDGQYTITPKVEAPKIVRPEVPTPPQANEKVSFVSKPLESESTKKITMSEIKVMQTKRAETKEDNSQAPVVKDVRVQLSQNSIVELVNGGINLPDGVEQEFYVVDDNENR